MKSVMYAALTMLSGALCHAERNLDALPHYLKGVRLASNSCQAALPHLQLATKLDPAFAQAWMEIALCQGRMGDWDAKVLGLRRSIQADPQYGGSYYHLALALALRGEAANAWLVSNELDKVNSALADKLRLVLHSMRVDPFGVPAETARKR